MHCFPSNSRSAPISSSHTIHRNSLVAPSLTLSQTNFNANTTNVINATRMEKAILQISFDQSNSIGGGREGSGDCRTAAIWKFDQKWHCRRIGRNSKKYAHKQGKIRISTSEVYMYVYDLKCINTAWKKNQYLIDLYRLCRRNFSRLHGNDWYHVWTVQFPHQYVADKD